MKILIILILSGIYSPSLSAGIHPSPSQPIAFQTKSESYASIIDKSPEKAWKYFAKIIADKPEIISLVDQTLEQIKPAIQFVAPEKMDKIMGVRNRIHVTPDNWKGHIMIIGNIAAKAGKIIVSSKTLGKLLHQLSNASERKDYISALGGIISYSFIYKNDPEMIKIADEWRKVENSVKGHLKKSRILKD